MFNLFLIGRLLEVISYKIFNVQKEDVILDCLNSAGTKTYRIEEIPKDEIDLSPDEILVPVAHFQKVTTLPMNQLLLLYSCYYVEEILPLVCIVVVDCRWHKEFMHCIIPCSSSDTVIIFILNAFCPVRGIE